MLCKHRQIILYEHIIYKRVLYETSLYYIYEAYHVTIMDPYACARVGLVASIVYTTGLFVMSGCGLLLLTRTWRRDFLFFGVLLVVIRRY